MNDERKLKQEPVGHATIPPGLRPFLSGAAQAEEHEHRQDAGMDAAFAKINDALGEDVQEIDPSVGVGNASRYVGPAAVPDGARGKAFTAKVKIIESPANDAQVTAAGADEETTADRAPPSSRGGLKLGGRTARLMAQAATAADHAPPVAVPEHVRAAPGAGSSRGRAVAVTIGALAVVVGVGVWVVAKGPHQASETPAPARSAVVSSAAAVPAMSASGAATVAAPTAPPPPALGTAEVDAGAPVAPNGPAGAAAYKPKGPVVKGEDPYAAAAPLPAKTADPVVPPAPAVTVAPSIVPTVAPRPPPTAPPAPSSGRILGSDEG
jgi:hypothetical protein